MPVVDDPASPQISVSSASRLTTARSSAAASSKAACGVQVVRPGVAGIPAQRTHINPAFQVEPQRQFRRPNADHFVQRLVLEPLVDLDCDRLGRQTDFARPIDVGVFPIAGFDVAADIHAEIGGKFGKASERREVLIVGVAEVDAHRRRLFAGGVIDANVNSVHGGSGEMFVASKVESNLFRLGSQGLPQVVHAQLACPLIQIQVIQVLALNLINPQGVGELFLTAPRLFGPAKFG